MKNLSVSLLLTTPLFAGVEAPIMAPPAPDCNAGFTVGLEALYLRAYQSDGNFNEGDYDFGGRGSLGYEFNDCLFIKATYFGYSSTVFSDGEDSPSSSFHTDADLDVSYIDLVVGQHFKPSEKLTLSPYVGLRYATYELGIHAEGRSIRTGLLLGETVTTFNESEDFSGLGVVVGIDGTRSLGNGFSLYGTVKQSVVFGTTDFSFSQHTESGSLQQNATVNSSSYSDDSVIFISELGLGAQYEFNIGSVAAKVHAGVEGQWWAGIDGGGSQKMSSGGSSNTGLAGFVLGADFNF